MRGLMQNWPMTLDRILAHAAHADDDRRIAQQQRDGSVVASTYAVLPDEARRIVFAAIPLGPTGRIDKLALRRLFAQPSQVEAVTH